MLKKFDLFVIGAGSGGVRAARMAGSQGLKVGIAESWSLGVTCVNRGCVPKKLYSYAAHFSSCLLYTSPSPRDRQKSRMPSSA